MHPLQTCCGHFRTCCGHSPEPVKAQNEHLPGCKRAPCGPVLRPLLYLLRPLSGFLGIRKFSGMNHRPSPAVAPGSPNGPPRSKPGRPPSRTPPLRAVSEYLPRDPRGASFFLFLNPKRSKALPSLRIRIHWLSEKMHPTALAAVEAVRANSQPPSAPTPFPLSDQGAPEAARFQARPLE